MSSTKDSTTAGWPIEFLKIQGAGNDFVVIDGRYNLPVSDRAAFARAVCDRHKGVGADGLIILSSSKMADFKMDYYNADGSEAICANGIRCISRFILVNSLLPAGRDSFELETVARTVEVQVIGKGERFRVDMGQPILDGKRIPTSQAGEQLNVALKVGTAELTISAIGMGNPHCVILVDDVEEADVSGVGAAIEHHEFFPERTNVEFVQVIDQINAKMRVWERGVGETLACGTGVCAALVSLVLNGKTNRQIAMETRGGVLGVAWNEDNNHLFLTGPAEVVYKGVLENNSSVAKILREE